MLPILAQASSDFTPFTPGAQITMWGCLLVVGQLVGIWTMLRRRPPIEADLVKLDRDFKALQQRQINFERRHIDEVKEVNDKLDELGRTLSGNMQTIERALGRIEGHQQE